MNFQYLFKEERQLLWKKYLKSGLDAEQANEKVKDFIAYLNKIKLKLEKQEKSKEDINLRFKEEFERLCQDLET